VYEPGQFAIRGGILDIYSFGNEKPYRIELFGNEVDSIRIFDPESQLSERKLLQVNIIPNVDSLPKTFGGDADNKVSLLEFLPENTVVWVSDWQFIKEKIEQQQEDLELYLAVMDMNIDNRKLTNEDDHEINEKAEVSEHDFTNVTFIEKQILQRHIIEFGTKSYFTPLFPTEQSSVVKYSIQSQPAFNRQFDLLIKNLKEFENNHYNIFLFADNPKQLERLHIIFTDLHAEIPVTPIPTSIHEGFIEHGFKTVPNDDQLIFKVEDDGNFIWAVKVVDNVLSIATSQHLNEQLVTSMEGSGYTVKNEAPDKFIGMQLEWNTSGDLLLHQERHEEKLLIKYNITKTASTPLPSNFSHTNYLTSGGNSMYPNPLKA
jgi:transcription-repair coupling factor (superfamily II helicase)